MPEYIEREELFRVLHKFYYKNPPYDSSYQEGYNRGLDCASREIGKLQAADVAPVVHGRWIEKTVPEGCRYFECSNCGAHENRHTAIKGYYCWRCGAKMDGGVDNETD